MRELGDGCAWVLGVGRLPFVTDDDYARVFDIVDHIVTAHNNAWVARLRLRYPDTVFDPTVVALSRRHTTAAGPVALDLLTDRWPIGPPVASVHREPAGVNRAA